MRTPRDQTYRSKLEREYRRVEREIARLEERIEGGRHLDAGELTDAKIALETAYAVRSSLADRLASRGDLAPRAAALATPVMTF